MKEQLKECCDNILPSYHTTQDSKLVRLPFRKGLLTALDIKKKFGEVRGVQLGQHMTGDMKVERVGMEMGLDDGKEDIELVKNLKSISTETIRQRKMNINMAI